MSQVCWSRINCDRNASKPAPDLKTLIRIELGSDLLSTGPQVSLTNELPPDPPLAWSDHCVVGECIPVGGYPGAAKMPTL